MFLSLVRIADHGSEEERLIIRAEEDCDLGWYMVFDTSFDETGISNRLRHLFIFPSISVKKGDFVWLYTNKVGQYHTHSNTSKTTTHNFYWGLDSRVWNNDGDRAYLVKYTEWASKQVPPKAKAEDNL